MSHPSDKIFETFDDVLKALAAEKSSENPLDALGLGNIPLDEIGNAFKKLEEKVETTVKEKPLTVLLAASLAGLVAGLWLSRK
ncbi:MAG: hypothetical protein J0L93_02855 [Deltaproteobacteria bacterium]|nr:hypothetical protein [Deltaproteobacteria bacterium]